MKSKRKHKLNLKVKKLGKHWWIIGDEEDGPYGPYSSKIEAYEDRKGILLSLENEDNRAYWTTEKKNTKKEKQ